MLWIVWFFCYWAGLSANLLSPWAGSFLALVQSSGSAKSSQRGNCCSLAPRGHSWGAAECPVLQAGARDGAESQGHGWSEVTSLGSAARRLSLACCLLEEEVKLTRVFQAGSQTAIILMFPAENRWFLAKLKFSMWKFLFCGSGISD